MTDKLKNILRAKARLDPGADELFLMVAENIPQLLWVTDAQGKTQYVNQRWLEYVGRPFEVTQAEGWANLVWPEDIEASRSAWLKAIAEGTPYDAEYRIQRSDGAFRWFLTRGVPVHDSRGEITSWFGTCTDIDDQKRREEAQRLLADIEVGMREAANPEGMLWSVVSKLGTYLKVSRCAFWEVDLEGDCIKVHRDFCNGAPSFAGSYPRSSFGSVIKDLEQGNTLVLNDLKTDPRTAHLFDAVFCKLGVLASITVPIMRGGRQVASLGVHHSSGPREWTPDEIELVETLADSSWLVVENARLYRETQAIAEWQQRFMRDVLSSVTEGKLHLCLADSELPQPLAEREGQIKLKPKAGLQELRDLIRRVAVERAFDLERTYDLVTGAGEAGMNALVHAGYGNVSVTSSPKTIQVHIRDSGTGIAVASISRATLERGFTTAGSLGHGFKLILQCVDRIWLETGPTGTVIVIEQDKVSGHPDWLRTIIGDR